MKFQTLPVKRRPASKGILRRLSAVTRSRKQRVAATATATDFEDDGVGSKITRALVIIFLFHIVAIGLVFIHYHYLAGRPTENPETAQSTTAEAPATAAVTVVQPRADAPGQATGEKPYIVKTGDNYARIAAAEGVDEAALRLLNKHVDIGPGSILKIPPPRVVAAESPQAVTTVRTQTPPDHDRALVEATPVDVSGAPKARAVRANETRETAATPLAASGKSYVVQSGDSIWRIARRSKVSQEALLRANGISDARKIKPGMKLVIPQN